MGGIFDPFLKALQDSAYWRSFEIPIPNSPESWVIVGVPAAILIALLLVLLFSPKRGRLFTINLRDTIETEDDWNIVIIRRSTAQNIWDPNAKSGLATDPIQLVSNGRQQSGRLRVNQQYDEDALGMSHKMAASLGIVTLDSSGKPVGGLAVGEARVRIAVPFWRIDLRTWRSPHPDVRMQWNLGTVFLVAGIVIPKALTTFLGW